jgi:hypothetical protein
MPLTESWETNSSACSVAVLPPRSLLKCIMVRRTDLPVNELSQKKTKLYEEINAVPRIGPYLVRLLNTLDSTNNNGNSSIEELELLIEELHKRGGVRLSERS